MDLSLNGGDLKVPLIGSHFDESSFSDEEVGPNGTSSRLIRNNSAAAGGGSHGKHSIGFGALVFLIYYNIGVPFGDEEAVKAAGPFMVSLAFFIILPIMWQIPICLVTAELTTTFPDHRGSISWVTEAFGPQWGFVDAVWSLATSFLDNALYPIIIADFLGLSGGARWAFVYCSIAALTWAVYRGSDVVASAEEVVFGLTMLPLVVMVGWGLFKMDWVAVTTPPVGGEVEWKLFIQIMFWTSTYWQKCKNVVMMLQSGASIGLLTAVVTRNTIYLNRESVPTYQHTVASVGPEVKDCSKNFPRAILFAAGMQTLINGVLHLVAAGATDPANYPDWKPGYLRYAADSIAGGQWLGAWLTISAAISNSGSFLSEMSVTSQTLIGMAERGVLPKKIIAESRHGTYPWALGIIVVLIVVSQPLHFHALVLACNFLYTLQTALELAAFYRLRAALPGLHRPYRVPGGRIGATLAVGLPALTLVAVTLTITMSAATFGSVIASASVVGAHFLFRSPGGIMGDTSIASAPGREPALWLCDDPGAGGGGGGGGGSRGITWDLKVEPRRVGGAGVGREEEGFADVEVGPGKGSTERTSGEDGGALE